MTWWSSCVGKPFVDGGRGPDAFDCWGLVCHIYRAELGIELPEFTEVSSSDYRNVTRLMGDPEQLGPWRKVRERHAFDVVVATGSPTSRRPGHVGLMIDRRRILHVWDKTNVCVMPINHILIAGRILSVWRYDAC